MKTIRVLWRLAVLGAALGWVGPAFGLPPAALDCGSCHLPDEIYEASGRLRRVRPPSPFCPGQAVLEREISWTRGRLDTLNRLAAPSNPHGPPPPAVTQRLEAYTGRYYDIIDRMNDPETIISELGEIQAGLHQEVFEPWRRADRRPRAVVLVTALGLLSALLVGAWALRYRALRREAVSSRGLDHHRGRRRVETGAKAGRPEESGL